MSSYEQTLHLFGRWLADELKIYTVDKITENVILRYIDDLMLRGKDIGTPTDFQKPAALFRNMAAPRLSLLF